VESVFVGPACPEQHTVELEQILADELIPAIR
jgi:hypothetical protein